MEDLFVIFVIVAVVFFSIFLIASIFIRRRRNRQMEDASKGCGIVNPQPLPPLPAQPGFDSYNQNPQFALGTPYAGDPYMPNPSSVNPGFASAESVPPPMYYPPDYKPSAASSSGVYANPVLASPPTYDNAQWPQPPPPRLLPLPCTN